MWHFTMYNVCSVHRVEGDTMSILGDAMSTSGDTMSTSGIPWVHRGISWVHRGIMSTSGGIQYVGVFNINWETFVTLLPHMHHDILPMYWTSPNVLMISPRCTHGISPMYSWYAPDVLMVSPRCTEHPPMYWTHIIQGDLTRPYQIEEVLVQEIYRNAQTKETGMSEQTIISIISTNLGPFGANSGITVGQSSSIRWYPSIFQKPHRFPGN